MAAGLVGMGDFITIFGFLLRASHFLIIFHGLISRWKYDIDISGN